jgi:plasmid rolling circle replication initiator protein Rep
MIFEIENKLDKAILKPELFDKMNLKKKIAWRNAYYIKKIADDLPIDDDKRQIFINRSRRICDCMTSWWWDLYRKNKVMDLRIVYRCNDIYCPNCRVIKLSIQLANFRKYFDDMVNYGYMPFFLTLTIPNIDLKDLGNKIDMLNKSFYRLWLWLGSNISRSDSFSKRMFDCKAALRSIEFTINKINNSCHLHLHAILFLDNYTEDLFEKEIPAYYRNKSDEQVLLSTADIEISKLWTMAVNKQNISEYKKLPDDWELYFKCDIRPLDLEKGIYEAFKYSFKDNDLIDFEVFKSVFLGFCGRRIRQSYGKIYKFNLNKNKEFDIKKEAAEISHYLDFEEEAWKVKTNKISELLDEFKNYKKISRFKAYREYVEIKE